MKAPRRGSVREARTAIDRSVLISLTNIEATCSTSPSASAITFPGKGRKSTAGRSNLVESHRQRRWLRARPWLFPISKRRASLAKRDDVRGRH